MKQYHIHLDCDLGTNCQFVEIEDQGDDQKNRDAAISLSKEAISLDGGLTPTQESLVTISRCEPFEAAWDAIERALLTVTGKLVTRANLDKLRSELAAEGCKTVAEAIKKYESENSSPLPLPMPNNVF